MTLRVNVEATGLQATGAYVSALDGSIVNFMDKVLHTTVGEGITKTGYIKLYGGTFSVYLY